MSEAFHWKQVEACTAMTPHAQLLAMRKILLYQLQEGKA